MLLGVCVVLMAGESFSFFIVIYLLLPTHPQTAQRDALSDGSVVESHHRRPSSGELGSVQYRGWILLLPLPRGTLQQ